MDEGAPQAPVWRGRFLCRDFSGMLAEGGSGLVAAARTLSIVDDYATTGVSGQGFVRFLFSSLKSS